MNKTNQMAAFCCHFSLFLLCFLFAFRTFISLVVVVVVVGYREY